MIEAILILSAVIIILGFICFFSIKSNIKKSGEIRKLGLELVNVMANANLVAKVETQKTDIRNEANETENDILNNTGINGNVMPHESKPDHNHDFGDPCGKDCPAYTNKG